MERIYRSGPEWPFHNRYSLYVPGGNLDLPSVERVRYVFEQYYNAYVAVDELAEDIVRFGFPRLSPDEAERLTDASNYDIMGESLVRLYSALVYGHRHYKP